MSAATITVGGVSRSTSAYEWDSTFPEFKFTGLGLAYTDGLGAGATLTFTISGVCT